MNLAARVAFLLLAAAMLLLSGLAVTGCDTSIAVEVDAPQGSLDPSDVAMAELDAEGGDGADDLPTGLAPGRPYAAEARARLAAPRHGHPARSIGPRSGVRRERERPPELG